MKPLMVYKMNWGVLTGSELKYSVCDRDWKSFWVEKHIASSNTAQDSCSTLVSESVSCSVVSDSL